ncbi:MAG TPA: ABC transporter substrate-binding protein [Thermoplasmata archaeon]|nr:ABC transporter substrate-binding protein [Thermoplasmata archaeon]
MSLNRSPDGPRSVTGTLVVVAILLTAGVAVIATAAYYGARGTTTAGTVTVVDDLGRTVTAPADASRVVVLAPSVMDIVYRLGLRDRVVGVGCTPQLYGGMLDEYSPNQTALWNLTSSMCVTDFPNLNTEEVATLAPQLVLASTLTSAGDVAKLVTTYNLPVVLLAPSTLDGIVGDVNLVAELFPSVRTVATALDASLEGILANATAFDTLLADNGTAIPSVLLTYYFDAGGYYTYGPGTFGQSLIDLADGSSISAGVPLEYAEINATVVLADQPTVLIYGTSWNDPYLVLNETPSAWPSAPYWGQLDSSKIPIDVTLLTEAAPSMLLELPWFLHWLHPTLAPVPTG